MCISGGARSYDDLGVVFHSPPAIYYKPFPQKDTDNLMVESIKC